MIAHDSTPILLGEIDTIKAGENVKKNLNQPVPQIQYDRVALPRNQPGTNGAKFAAYVWPMVGGNSVAATGNSRCSFSLGKRSGFSGTYLESVAGSMFMFFFGERPTDVQNVSPV